MKMKLINHIRSYKRTVVAPIASYPILKVSGHEVQEILNDPIAQVEALKLLNERISTDLLVSFMDLSLEAEALGLKIKYDNESSPQLIEHPVKTIEDLKRLDINGIEQNGRIPVFLRVQELMKKVFSQKNGSYIASPFTLAGLLMGAETLAINTVLKPALCDEVISFSTKVAMAYAKALERAGADFIVILDPSAVLISPQAYEKFILPYNKKLIEALNVPVILHTCGNTTKIIDLMVKTKAEALSLDSLVNLREVRKIIPDDVVIMGNLDPVKVFLEMEAEQVYQTTIDFIKEMKGIDNFILSTGCDLPFQTAIDNISAFCKASHDIKFEHN